MKMSKVPHVVLIAAALLGAGACDKLGLPGGGTGTSATDADAGKKLDGYVGAYNAFIDSLSFEGQAEAYRKASVARASLSDYELRFDFGPGTIAEGLAKLKAARALSGGPAAMDAAADKLLASMGQVEAHFESLDPYYRGNKYLEDKLARGKAEDAQMLAQIAAAENDLHGFSDLLDVATDTRNAAMLDKLKSGDPLLYQTKLALMHGKRLVGLFKTPADAHNPQVIAKADAEVATVEQAIAAAHAELSKQGKPDSQALRRLTYMIGYYRTFKARDELMQIELMGSAYNDAVAEANNQFSAD